MEREDEFIEVPIPRRYVLAVYGYIAGLEAAGGRERTARQGKARSTDEEQRDIDWTIAKLRRIYWGTHPIKREIMAYLAERPDIPVGRQELADAVVAGDVRSLDAHLATLTMLAERYRILTRAYELRSSAKTGESEYVMPSVIAERVQQVALERPHRTPRKRVRTARLKAI